MRITDTSDLWWKTAVVYCLDVETYMDWNGDGVGDFEGLSHRIDYLADLGVTCVWLMPFYPTPDRDDGYDVVDFYDVDERLGSLGDFVEFVRTAHDRGIRVIADLVVNHTSDQHPWFRSARARKDSPFRDFYIWRSDPPPDTSDEVVYPGEQEGIWEHDEKTGEWFLHRFYKHQPDLNVANPAVRDEVARIMGFWLQLGLSGFRVDAVPFFLEALGMSEKAQREFSDPHAYQRDLRSFLGRRRGDAILLGEVGMPYEDQMAYFGDGEGDELTMQFDFTIAQRLFLSLARQDARPLVEALRSRPSLPREEQWANFVRNHDELSLELLSGEELEEVMDAFAPEERMRVYGRGIVRRLPSMLDGDPRRIRMVYSLMFSLPGTPVLFYGEEIGMGENLDLPDRQSVRTPMQWADGPTGGFSSAKRSKLVAPPVEGGFGPEHVNVQDQRHDPDSLLNFMATLIHRYRESPEIGWGEYEVIDQPYDHVLVHRCSWDESSVIALHNFHAEPCVVPLRLKDENESTRLDDLLQPGSTSLDESGRAEITLDGYGYRWLRVSQEGDLRLG
ncbi:trehalose synthase [Phytoactinopolyspora alkaliphila]|uniref:Trehalose synthase n=1 Tax=Phytoactinopolyspora alkaliphila TaxID=1783498 RepID=A0A6N9YHX6_9ACTN|nr:alpha-amylase family protein [Phytoactinopolyspora alkaliphila]NED94498.1 trehalose synthase [Phytoactinopolyspora alkaliphila]